MRCLFLDEMLRGDPLESERIMEDGNAVAKGLVRRRHDASGARSHGPSVGGIDVIHIPIEAALQRRFTFTHFENRVSDANCAIDHSAAMLVQDQLLRTHRPLQELHVLSYMDVMHEGRDGPETSEGRSGTKMRRDVPLVAGGILHEPSPFTVDLVFRFTHRLRTRVECALVSSVAIRNVHVQSDQRLPSACGLLFHNKNVGVSDSHSGNKPTLRPMSMTV